MPQRTKYPECRSVLVEGDDNRPGALHTSRFQSREPARISENDGQSQLFRLHKWLVARFEQKMRYAGFQERSRYDPAKGAGTANEHVLL